MISGIIAGIGAILAFFFFKRSQNAEALLNVVKTKEEDLDKKQEILKNQAQESVETSNRDSANTAADNAKKEELSNEELANDLANRLKP